MIENITLQIQKLNSIGLTKINTINANNDTELLSKICTFEKGYEVGSKAYNEEIKENYIRYIRVGDLANGSPVYVESTSKLKICKNNDILIAFDGAPGRIGTGFDGAYSSGLYKVIAEKEYLGLVYFELLSSLNQKIISDNSQGTTILHASHSIDYLQFSNACNKDIFTYLFDEIISLQSKRSLLIKQKNFLLTKYFS